MYDPESAELVRRLESVELPAGGFGHEAHLRAAWWCLQHDGPAAGGSRFRSALRRFAAAQGVPEKYHETLTTAFLDLIELRRRPQQSWAEFRRDNEDLLERPHEVIARPYSAERLATDEAGRGYVEPDREPVPAPAPLKKVGS